MAVTISGTTGVITPDLTSTGTTVLAAGKVRSWSATDTDIDGLISGSTFGVLAEGGNSGHFTVGLRSNDLNDGFQVISKGTATTPDTDPYTALCFEVKANGNVGIGTGTTGVGNRLHISSPLTGTTPRSNSVLRIQSEATGRDVNIQLSDNITNSAELGMVGGAMYMATAGTERMRIDGSGNVSIGGTSTLGKLDVTGSVYASVGYILPNDQTLFWGSGDGSTRIQGNSTSDVMSLYTVGAERIRIESTGNVGIGTAPTGFSTHTNAFITTYCAGALALRGGAGTSGRFWTISSENAAASNLTIYNAVGTGQYMAYGTTAWTANSDERLKTTLTPFSNAIEKVSTLRAGTGRYLTDEENVSRSFLIAQDVLKVLPEAVDVRSDEIGTLGLRYTELIPLLTAAIQEQQALIASLTARISALENK